MYKHMLIATDGSDFALRAARHGLQLAKANGTKVSVITVTPPWHAISLSEIALGHAEEQYDQRINRYAEDLLAKVGAAAKELGIACDIVHLSHERAYEAIIDTAKKRGCDLIVVGSHGRRGITGLVLGSETVKVLTHSKVPVLVYRE